MDWSKISLIFWQTGTKEKADASAFSTFIDTWWLKVRGWLEFPLRVYDVDTAPMFIVDMLAWERDVDRFNGESESLYRLRVKTAYENAKDAGSAAGFKRIWTRLGLGNVTITERVYGDDWDIVEIQMAPADIASNEALINLLVDQYGRTCRRYQITTQNESELVAVIHSIQTDTSHLSASTDAFGQLITFNGEPLTITGELLEIN
ncbi:phage tail protein [Oceanobacter sp. 4_MG-2023]|uniref:phage tail protein n=1 Tax=Oceanobacter sp. 4_MG-2023 TaxID=3062623 RepID=UPI0027368040|nr:phage tail protein [Oceanobacter sp. 4_MG-2023]MDP2548905.1 phage tail protein [Oceanobacter sp. 4_MG-2023]